MILYLDATTKVPDLIIDYIEVKLQDGRTVSLNWDESDISRSETGFSARYKGVYFDEEYANGRLAELEGMQITEVGLYSDVPDIPLELAIESMEFQDGDRELTFEHPPIGADEQRRQAVRAHMAAANRKWEELEQAGFHSGGWDPKRNTVAIFQGDYPHSKYVGYMDNKTLEITWLDQTRATEPATDVKKIKAYDLEALFAEHDLVPFHYNKAAVFDGTHGVIVAEHEAVHMRENRTSDSIIIPATPPNEPGKIWALPKYEVTLSIDELMTAPYTEMTMDEFFDRRTYNPRCESNYALLMRNLHDIGFDLHGYFPVQRPTLESQIDAAADKQTKEKRSGPERDQGMEPDR